MEQTYSLECSVSMCNAGQMLTLLNITKCIPLNKHTHTHAHVCTLDLHFYSLYIHQLFSVFAASMHTDKRKH